VSSAVYAVKDIGSFPMGKKQVGARSVLPPRAARPFGHTGRPACNASLPLCPFRFGRADFRGLTGSQSIGSPAATDNYLCPKVCPEIDCSECSGCGPQKVRDGR